MTGADHSLQGPRGWRSIPRRTRTALRSQPAGRWRALGALFFLLALVGWAYASPVGASPDEDYHLASIWCSHGFQDGVCEPGDSTQTRRVPAQFPEDTVCYRWEPYESAACQSESPPAPGELVDTDRGNFAGVYPPVFYWINGLFVSDSVTVSVLAMRLFNALLFVALVIAVYLLVPPGLRRPLVAGALVTVVPLGVFLIPSINPSTWAIVSGTTFLVSMLGYLTVADRRRRIALGAVAGLALLLGAGARADAAVYAVIALATALILVWRRGRPMLMRLIYPAVLTMVAAAFYLSAGQSEAAAPEATQQPHSLGRMLHTILDIPALWIGGAGAPAPQRDFYNGYPWGLGWQDTAMPAIVWVGGWTLYAAVLLAALAGADRRRIAAVSLLGAALVLIPSYLQYLTALPVGGMIQPRYILPLMTMLAVTAMVRFDGPAFRLTQRARWAIVALLSLANAVALHANLRRYITGNDVTFWNLDRDLEWWWSIPISPMGLLVLTSLAFAAAAVLLSAELTTAARATGDTDPISDDGPEPGVPSGRHRRGETMAPTA